MVRPRSHDKKAEGEGRGTFFEVSTKLFRQFPLPDASDKLVDMKCISARMQFIREALSHNKNNGFNKK